MQIRLRWICFQKGAYESLISTIFKHIYSSVKLITCCFNTFPYKVRK